MQRNEEEVVEPKKKKETAREYGNKAWLGFYRQI